MVCDWADVAEAIPAEKDRLTVASAATSEEEFDEAFDAELEDWKQIAALGLEFGIAELVIALSAAGCVTAGSCRGGSSHVNDYPWVRFFADSTRAVMVRDLAAAAGCGFISDRGLLEVFAPSMTEATRLAELIRVGRTPTRLDGTGAVAFGSVVVFAGLARTRHADLRRAANALALDYTSDDRVNRTSSSAHLSNSEISASRASDPAHPAVYEVGPGGLRSQDHYRRGD